MAAVVSTARSNVAPFSISAFSGTAAPQVKASGPPMSAAAVMAEIQSDLAGFQRTLPLGLFVEADYVGSKTTHINAIYNANQPFLNGPAPYAAFGYLEFTNPLGNGVYHGLDFTLEHRFKTRLSFRAAYTLSKNIDNVSETLESLGSGTSQNIRNFARGAAPATSMS